jgi:sigma-B regulation protein RsbU (phosphoserine phosphatase)
MAARIQRTLLPRPDWSIDGWRARYHYQPANLVSGDYCDLIETQDGFLFLLGDVAGKGVAASMLMSHLHATFRTLAGQRLPLSMLMEHANRLFCESTTAGQFATMIVGSATPDGRVEYVSAGHLPFFHVSSTGARPREATGVPLGMFSSTEFPVCEVRMAPGDKLLLYTDGLTETADAAGKEYGVARVQALAKTHAAAEPQDLVAACLDEVRSFSANAKQADDLTLLVLHRTH